MNFYLLSEAAYQNKNQCPYWGDGGSGLMALSKDTKKFLLNLRSPHVNEGNTWGLFGGGIFIDQTPYQSIEELAKTDYPKQNAIKELKEETGYSGSIQLTELYVYKDAKVNKEGKPCNFYYWNYLGIVPTEFPVKPEQGHEWEDSGNSRWMTIDEVFNVTPQHFGLKSLLANARQKLISAAS